MLISDIVSICLVLSDFHNLRVLTPIISVYTVISGILRFKSRCSKGTPYTGLLLHNKEFIFFNLFLIYMSLVMGSFQKLFWPNDLLKHN